MAGGWKCARCSTVNDDIVVSCKNCGLSRGAVAIPTRPEDSAAPPPPATPTPWGTEPPPAASPTPSDRTAAVPEAVPVEAQSAPTPLWRRIPIGWVLFGLLILGGAVSSWYFSAGRSDSGDISKAGDLDAKDLRAGDCFDLKDPEAEEIGDVTAKPCTEEHEYEVFFVGALPDGPYPSDQALEQFGVDNCGPAFMSYVGKAFSESMLWMTWLSPTSDGWTAGDRSIQCVVYDPNAKRLTQSLRGAAR